VADPQAGLEIRAEELRRASETFGRIAGTVDVEEVLGVIFSEFCIGK
jgi:tRNA modification GTPase